MKSAEVLRFPRIKNHIEEFIAYDLPCVLENLKLFGLINGYGYTCRITYEFKRGVDFYVFVEGRQIPIQLTDNPDMIPVFLNQGIMTIFLPEKDKKGEKLFPSERKEIVMNKLEKISKQVAYFK